MDRYRKKFIYIISIIITILIFISIGIILLVGRDFFRFESRESDGIDYLIGVSQSQLRDPWQININEDIKKEVENYDNVQIIYTDAAGNADKQINDINKLMDYGIDLLIISPNSSKIITEKVAEVYEELPVIVLDRGVEGYDYSLYIGPDNLTLGNRVAKYISRLLGSDGGAVVEITGHSDSSASNERSLGIRQELDNIKGIEITHEIEGQWSKDIAEDAMLELFNNNNNIDVVFAHSDAMAIGAYNAYKNSGYEKQVYFIGIDGVLGENGGIEAVNDGILSCTFTCPTGGKEAVQYAIDILKKRSGIPKKVILGNQEITRVNVNEYISSIENKIIIERNEPIVLGFCNVGNEGGWRAANTVSIKNAAKEAGIELIYAEANNSQEDQIEIIRGFINLGVDVISFSPIVESGWDDILIEANEAGIPLILSDRLIKNEDSQLYTTFLGSDFREEGRRAARWVITNMDITKELNVVEIQGARSSTPAVERKKGFEELIEDYSNINIILSKTGNYTFDDGKAVMNEFLCTMEEENKEIHLVYSHNDDMALGAIEAIEEYGLKPGEDIKIVSIDGIKQAILAIRDGKLNCSVECNPIIGPQIMKLVKDIVEGKELPIKIITDETIFTDEGFKLEWLNRSY